MIAFQLVNVTWISRIPHQCHHCVWFCQVQFLYFWKAFAEAARIAGWRVGQGFSPGKHRDRKQLRTGVYCTVPLGHLKNQYPIPSPGYSWYLLVIIPQKWPWRPWFPPWISDKRGRGDRHWKPLSGIGDASGALSPVSPLGKSHLETWKNKKRGPEMVGFNISIYIYIIYQWLLSGLYDTYGGMCCNSGSKS